MVRLDELRSMVARAAGEPPRARGISDFAAWLPADASTDVKEYLLQLVCDVGYLASGIRVLSVSGLEAENSEFAHPGRDLLPAGFIVLATSIGGNAICASVDGSGVFWADQSAFGGDLLSFSNPDTGEWIEVEASSTNVPRVLVQLAPSLEEFLTALLNDELLDRLNKLD